MKKTALALITLATVSGFASPAWAHHPPTSSTTSTSEVTTSTSQPPSTTTSQPTSSTSVESSTTTTEATTTTTVSGPTTTIFIGYIEWPYGPGPLTTATNPPVTDAPTTTVAPEATVLDDVELIPAVSIASQDRLPETGFAYGWVAGIGIFALLLGAYLLAVYRRWTA